MTSPFRRKAEQLAAERKLPADNWLARRVAGFEQLRPSIRTIAETMHALGSMFLNGEISTDIKTETYLDFHSTRATDSVGYAALSVIPSLEQGVRRHIPEGRGFSWTPDVAMQVSMSIEDHYTRDATRKLVPTGNLELQISARTWGRLTEAEIADIGQVENAWAEYSDLGHSRNGSLITVLRKTGETICREEAETLLAPLVGHVIGYFDLVSRPDLKEFQVPGSFSSHLAPEVTLTRDWHMAQFSPELFTTDYSELPPGTPN